LLLGGKTAMNTVGKPSKDITLYDTLALRVASTYEDK
jgi:hypothetical protein